MGNGEDISIWGDAWLPSIESPRLANPMGFNFPEIRVSSLTKRSTQGWDDELLRAYSAQSK